MKVEMDGEGGIIVVGERVACSEGRPWVMLQQELSVP